MVVGLLRGGGDGLRFLGAGQTRPAFFGCRDFVPSPGHQDAGTG